MDNITELRDALRSPDDAYRWARALRAAIKVPEQNVSLLPELYVLCNSDCRPVASDSWAAITVFGRHAVPFLLNLMESDEPGDRQDAIDLLLGLHHHRSTFRIARPILDPRPDSRPDWGEHETKVKDRLHLALHDSDPGVRLLAAFTLDEIDEAPDDLVPRLIEGLSRSDLRMQTYAALHLGRLGRKAMVALPVLRDLAQLPLDADNRVFRAPLTAAFAIRRIEEDQADANSES